MKKLTIFLLLFVATVVNGQTKFRDDVFESDFPGVRIITAPTPAFFDHYYYMQFSLHKIILPDQQVQYVLQAGHVSTQDCGPGRLAITIRFTDNDYLEFTRARYQPEYVSTIYASQTDFIPTVLLNDVVMQKLKTKKIKYFTVDGDMSYNLAINNFANKVKAYATWLTNLN